MDYSAVVIPVTRADKTVDKSDPHYEPLNDVDAKNWEACQYGVFCLYHRVLTIVR